MHSHQAEHTNTFAVERASQLYSLDQALPAESRGAAHHNITELGAAAPIAHPWLQDPLIVDWAQAQRGPSRY